jgi:hypothetical protein
MSFEFAVREKHVTEIVCQFCDSLDQSDPEQMDMHFSTLDTQVRACFRGQRGPQPDDCSEI